MSIAAMNAYAEVTRGADRNPVGTNADEGRGKKELARITAYVPTEAIATYVALLGLIEPGPGAPRWILLGITALIAIFLCWYFWSGATTELPGKVLVWQCVFALVGLAAWASALPNSPFFSFDWYSARYGAAAVIILSPVIPRVAERLKIAPPRDDDGEASRRPTSR